MSSYTVKQFLKDLKSPYAWPGGYPRYFVTSDGEALSFKTAKAEKRNIASAIKAGDNSGWRVLGCDINWEDTELYDAHTGERIESAYGEDEVKKNPARKRKLKPVSGIVHCKRNPRKRRARSRLVSKIALRKTQRAGKIAFHKARRVSQRQLQRLHYTKRKAPINVRIGAKRNPSRKLAPAKRHRRFAKLNVRIGRRIGKQNRPLNAPFYVQVMRNGEWQTLGTFFNKINATDYGRALAAKYPKHTFRVYWK